MTDVFDRQKRSEIMSSIRSKNTKAEVIAFRYLRSNNIYFQKHYARAPGKPDIALPRKKKAVFIDGGFWHGSSYKKILIKRGPDDYWSKKIAANINRDALQRGYLVDNGWSIFAVDERNILRKRTQQATLEKIMRFLKH